MAGHNFGRQAKRQQRRDTKHAHAQQHKQLWTPPPAEHCDPEETVKIPIDDCESLLVTRIRRCNGRIVDFAIMQIVGDDENAIEICRVDCCHGLLHRHGPPHALNDERQFHIIHELFTQEDVEDSFDEAYDYVFDHMIETERAWKHAKQR